jgi:hypothetical protein
MFIACDRLPLATAMEPPVTQMILYLQNLGSGEHSLQHFNGLPLPRPYDPQ